MHLWKAHTGVPTREQVNMDNVLTRPQWNCRHFLQYDMQRISSTGVPFCCAQRHLCCDQWARMGRKSPPTGIKHDRFAARGASLETKHLSAVTTTSLSWSQGTAAVPLGKTSYYLKVNRRKTFPSFTAQTASAQTKLIWYRLFTYHSPP